MNRSSIEGCLQKQPLPRAFLKLAILGQTADNNSVFLREAGEAQQGLWSQACLNSDPSSTTSWMRLPDSAYRPPISVNSHEIKKKICILI